MILQRLEQGDPHAANELLPLVYQELRKLAARKMAHEAPGQTLQATALVHEAWLRLGGDEQPTLGDGRVGQPGCDRRVGSNGRDSAGREHSGGVWFSAG